MAYHIVQLKVIATWREKPKKYKTEKSLSFDYVIIQKYKLQL